MQTISRDQESPDDDVLGPNDAKFTDVLGVVAVVVVLIFALSFSHAWNLRSQVTDTEKQVRSLEERVATLQQQLINSQSLNHFDSAEKQIPHPDIKDRDTQVIGDHINVSWDYPANLGGRYINFEIELVNLDCNPDTHAVTANSCAPHSRFITSDGANRSSRIPALTDHLKAGSYAWRVAPVPAGTVVDHLTDPDDSNRLSEWSNFGSFTIYPTVLSRLKATGIVRVGTNLEQDTRFSRKNSDGSIGGFDINLIYALIEKCIHRDDKDRIKFDLHGCDAYVTQRDRQAPFSRPADCLVGASHLCVELVPIQKWGAWPAALRRKEIDLFIGAATAAKYREKGGIKFTRGYLSYRSLLYGHRSDVDEAKPDFKTWVSSKRLVGVIDSSSNEYLLDGLADEVNRDRSKSCIPLDQQPVQSAVLCGNKLEKRSFSSFPAMEHAMDRGELDGVLIDETFVEHKDWIPLNGIRRYSSWCRYISEYINGIPPSQKVCPSLSDYLNTSMEEQVGIAVAVDMESGQSKSGTNELYEALQEGLSKKSPLVDKYIPVLCSDSWVGSPSEPKLCGQKVK